MSRVDKPQVLLVDDNEATCTLVTALLQREFTIEVASDGTEAVEHLRTKKYASILLDLRMPGLDGYGVLEFLQATTPETLRRVLVLTASLSEREVARVKEFDVCGIVAKPFEVETLLGAVRSCAGLDERPIGRYFFSNGVILLLAEVLRQRLG
ncbi:MAG TPA: response regulator [Thermoanaerobaculia bacterium]|jgi:CheY-like chemotaxis protein|nr:response regulator [Thermoanaerobaculia bacterium]